MNRVPLLVASSNEGKLKEFRRILGNRFDLTLPRDHGIEPPEVIEDGQTYYENALKKALGFYRIFKTPVIADDSGLEVDALDGAPGVFSARFGGTSISWPERWGLLWKKLADVREPWPEPWSARFRCVLCYYDGRKVPRFFEATAEGHILKEAKGSEGFGYDPVFFSTTLQKSFGVASPSEKEKVSHRALATESFLKWAETHLDPASHKE